MLPVLLIAMQHSQGYQTCDTSEFSWKLLHVIKAKIYHPPATLLHNQTCTTQFPQFLLGLIFFFHIIQNISDPIINHPLIPQTGMQGLERALLEPSAGTHRRPLKIIQICLNSTTHANVRGLNEVSSPARLHPR